MELAEEEETADLQTFANKIGLSTHECTANHIVRGVFCFVDETVKTKLIVLLIAILWCCWWEPQAL